MARTFQGQRSGSGRKDLDSDTPAVKPHIARPLFADFISTWLGFIMPFAQQRQIALSASAFVRHASYSDGNGMDHRAPARRLREHTPRGAKGLPPRLVYRHRQEFVSLDRHKWPAQSFCGRSFFPLGRGSSCEDPAMPDRHGALQQAGYISAISPGKETDISRQRKWVRWGHSRTVPMSTP
jgi:hypothetical protein